MLPIKLLTTSTPQYTLATSISTSHESPRHRARRIMAGGAYIATPVPSQTPLLMSAGARNLPHAQTCSSLPAQPHAHLGAPDTWTLRQMPLPIPHSERLHTASATTMRRWSEPPPLNFSKSPYRCIPLPDTGHGPVIFNPVLAYSHCQTVHEELNISQGCPVEVRRRHHVCGPATNPSVGFATILLPNGRGITIHGSLKSHGVITVGDVLDALDTLLLGKPSRELSLPVEATDGDLNESCACLSGATALHCLRSRYEWAGLTWSEEGFDVWDLRIG